MLSLQYQPLLKDWKYNAKTKRYYTKTDYAKYVIGKNSERGIFMQFTLLKVYDSGFNIRNKHFWFDNLSSIKEAIEKYTLIDEEEEEKHIRKLKKEANRKANKRFYLSIQFGCRCKRCDYNNNWRIFQFHHIDSSEKKIYSKNNEASLDEVSKHPERFEMLCPNCHTEHHINEHRERRENTMKKILEKKATRESCIN